MPTATIDPDRIAARVRWLRAEHGWTQAQLADKAGRSLRVITKVEAGMPCHERTYVLVARALGIPLAELLNGKGE